MRYALVVSVLFASLLGCGRYDEMVFDDGLHAQLARSHEVVVYEPVYVVEVEQAMWAPPDPSCERSLDATGHWPSSNIFCDPDVDRSCAQALLQAGHSPTELMFCRNVDASCAVAHLMNGGSPITLGGCRY